MSMQMGSSSPNVQANVQVEANAAAAPATSVVISPATVVIRGVQQQQFSATIRGMGASSVVHWMVNNIQGGTLATGVINTQGLYSAPTKLPGANVVKITASYDDATVSPGQASVTLENPLPVPTSVTPTTIYTGPFSIHVRGTDFAKGAIVHLGGTALTTVFVSSSELMASGTLAATRVGNLAIAVSNPNPGAATTNAVFTLKVVALPSASIVVSPPNVLLRPRQTQIFVSTVKGSTSAKVTWMVNGVAGGSVRFGTIAGNGTYVAPPSLPSPNTIKVTASTTDKTLAPGQSVVTLGNPAPIPLSVSPTSVFTGAFTVSVSGGGFVPGSIIYAGSTPLSTTYVGPATLTGRGTITTVGNYAISVANPNPGAIRVPGKFALSVQPPQTVKIAVSPALAAVSMSQAFQFKATVTGSTNTGVRWLVENIEGGNSLVGTITTTGLYTAPSTIPARPMQVTATSRADSRASKVVQAQIENQRPTITSLSPTQLTVGSFSIVVNGTNFLNGTQVVFGGTGINTLYNSPTQLTGYGSALPQQVGTALVQVRNPGPGLPTSAAVKVSVVASTTPPKVSATAAARFLEQSTFGPTPDLIATVQRLGFQTWLSQQFAATPSIYPTPGPTDDISVVQKRFFTNTVNDSDQLRQRVSFALSQIFVVSSNKITDPKGLTLWMNMLQKDAFGNHFDLLRDVTLSPTMGNYLDMVNNDGCGTCRPNENYAREFMQLFTIGLAKLNPDGTPQLDANGQPIPTYTQDTVTGLAAAFTGWSYPAASPQFFDPPAYTGPMVAFEAHHSTGSKTLLDGFVLSAGGTTQSDLTAALQAVFNHPNAGPFLAKRLIQKLVTSNPSPDYVARVAAVFDDDGTGKRGNLQAVVTAILLDTEARRGDDPTQAGADDGHLKEPLLFIVNLMRAGKTLTDGANIAPFASAMGQNPFTPSSVFNFYPPDNVIEGTQLLGPEFKLLNETTSVARINFVNTLLNQGIGTATTLDLGEFASLAGNPSNMVDALATVMLHGALSDDSKAAIVNAVSAYTSNADRAKAAFYLIGSSSQFQVEH